MTKMATVHAQQMWEYLSINRKTDEFLITDLNELGKLGWELAAASFNKDVKGVGMTFSWTAILKRPLVSHPAAAGSTPEAATAPPEAPRVFDNEPEVFDVRS
jgi:hypothetical protein